MIKAIMNGCNGKMGQVISAICKEDPQIEIVAGVDLYDGIKNDYPVFPNISVCDVKADVIIDFSNAKAVDDLLVYSVDKKDSSGSVHDGIVGGTDGAGKGGIGAGSSIKVREYVAGNQSADAAFSAGGNDSCAGRI